jgi:predicted ATPase
LVTAAPELAALVRRCPGLCVLATSQRALRAAGERLMPLEPLPVAAAVDLFARRAGAVAPGFAVTDANRPAVTAICRQVDGLPLAIELAAARMRLLSPAELAARLDRPLLLLTGGARDLPTRHRSLRAAIESSLEMVSDDARTAFAWLAPFVAGARLADLEVVAGRLAAEPGWLLDALAELVESSLLQVRTGDTETRYVLLDAVRDLSTEQLRARVDRPRVERAFATHYLARLTAANHDGDRAVWAGLDADADNVRAALAWARAGDPAVADAGVVEALYRYCDLRGRFVEGRAELVALADSGAAGSGRALVRAAQFSQFLGDLDEAYDLVLRGQRQMAADDHAGRALAGLVLGTRAYKRGDFTAATMHITAALHDAQATGDRRTIGWALNNLAAVTAQAGDWSGAQDLLLRALAAKEQSGADDVDMGRTLILLAELALATRQWGHAVEHAARAADTLGRAGHARLEAAALSALALARLDGAGRTRDVDGAARTMEQAVRLLDSFGQDQWIRGLVQTRHSVVLHALGRRDDVPSVLADALRATRTDPMLYTLPPVIECHAALLARRRPPAAARLRDLARAIRQPDERAPRPPASAVLATMVDIVTTALSSSRE